MSPGRPKESNLMKLLLLLGFLSPLGDFIRAFGNQGWSSVDETGMKLYELGTRFEHVDGINSRENAATGNHGQSISGLS